METSPMPFSTAVCVRIATPSRKSSQKTSSSAAKVNASSFESAAPAYDCPTPAVHPGIHDFSSSQTNSGSAATPPGRQLDSRRAAMLTVGPK
eukprot:gene1064-biopygen1073